MRAFPHTADHVPISISAGRRTGAKRSSSGSRMWMRLVISVICNTEGGGGLGSTNEVLAQGVKVARTTSAESLRIFTHSFRLLVK
ncbi:Hypothetical protein FKW44_018866 [Caligus rogercresseyi]|uniref:Uncharacterized protein n=1 Tax=Caligus rogercresseyi TaxID=217165 RepID=A0A7T8JYC7_CALRO|nr:Hypothetical protein FKW44_018866 [Caligus rogercresseyi]